MFIISSITTIQYGFGTLKYRFFFLDLEKQVQSISSGEYLVKLLISLLVLSFFLVTAIYLFSLVTKNTIGTLVMGICLVLPGLMPEVLKLLPNKILNYLPFGYFNLPELIFARSGISGWLPTWRQGVFYLSLISVFFFLLALLKIKRENKKMMGITSGAKIFSH